MKKVVVIGGGFAGSQITKSLERDFDVTLIDTKEYFEFTPGILRTLVEPEHLAKIQILHADYLKSAKIIVDVVKEAGKNFVKLQANGKVYFDYLAICAGSSYNLPFKEQKVIPATRAKHLKESNIWLEKASKILIVGGGLVGVELAGEICWKYPNKEIIIVHSHDKLIERNNEKAARYAQDFLTTRGVKFIFNERIVKHARGIYITNKGTKIAADMAFLATGIKPNYGFMKKNFSNYLNERNVIKVNEYLQMEDNDNIFVAGDVAGIVEEKTAQNAEMHGKVVAHNIGALDNGRKLLKYQTKKRPMIISLGKNNAIFVKESFVWNGKIPALMKWAVEKREMWKKRI